jgi:hypothetical protein
MYTLTTIRLAVSAWVVGPDRQAYLNDVSGDYPGYVSEDIMRDLGHCSVGDTGSCMQYSVSLPYGRYSKKVITASVHYGYEFRIQYPDDNCKNLGEYMTNSIKVKNTRSS